MLDISASSSLPIYNAHEQFLQPTKRMPDWIAALGGYMAPNNPSSFTAVPVKDTCERELVTSILPPSSSFTEELTENVSEDEFSLSTTVSTPSEHLAITLPPSSSVTKELAENANEDELSQSITVSTSSEHLAITLPNDSAAKTSSVVTGNSFHPGEISMISLVFEMIRLFITLEVVDRKLRFFQQSFMVMHMERVSENLLNQSKMILTAAIFSGVLGILGGLMPIVGIVKGKAILNKVGNCSWCSSLKDAKPEKVFYGFSRMMESSSRMTEMANRAQTTQLDSVKYREESRTKIFEIEQGETTRSLESRHRQRETFLSMLERFFERWWQFIQSLSRS